MLLLFVALSSFRFIYGGSIRGTVTPPEAGLHAFLFSTKDTVSVNVINGSFQFPDVKAGSYKLLIEAAPPYRNGTKDGIVVTDGKFTDAGQVELLK